MEQPLSRPRIGLKHVVWAVLIYCALVTALAPRRTYDIWWHLATGQQIVETRSIPDADPFTWTREGETWIAHEWAWDLPMYLLFDQWGHGGLMLLRTLTAVMAGALLAWLLLRRGATPVAAMAVGALAIFAAQPLFNDRPQIATIPFFVAMLCLIEQAERGRERWLLAAPLLMIPWVNLHGGFIYGPALLGLYALCKVPGWFSQWRQGEGITPCPGIVAAGIALAAVACLANPNGVAGATYPLEYIFGGHAWHTDVITEYASPDFHQPIFLHLMALIVAMTAILAASRRQSSLWEIALVAVFLFTALRWQRNAALFAFAVAPMLSLHLSDLLTRGGLVEREQLRGQGAALLHVAIIAVLIVSAAVAVPAALDRADGVFALDIPVESVQYVMESGIEGRMYNTYRWGGYLIWHLWPEHRVFVDGRADVMGRKLVEDWRKAHRLESGWHEVLEEYEIDWALVSVSAPLARGLEVHPDWDLAFVEPTANLFVREGSVAADAVSAHEARLAD